MRDWTVVGKELTAKGKATRGRIIDGAAQVVRERGVSLATLEDIMARTQASKSQLETLTRAWAAEFGPRGVRVNAISPGVILDLPPGSDHPAATMMTGTPAGRIGAPDAIGQAAVYLASDEAAFVHGITLDVDGGRTTAAVIAA